MNSITPPWLSCYVEGHEQRLHTDPAHGPWAFVLSLTPDEVAEAMSGGETQVSYQRRRVKNNTKKSFA
jgi:hypothetical protein